MPDISKEKFIEMWGESGYQQVFDSEYDYLEPIQSLLDVFSDKNQTVLEIGCGSGFWTNNLLVPRFKKIIAVDLIPKPVIFEGNDKIEYIELKNADYSLPGIADDSIDFVWSFGVFCHFTNEAVIEYLKSVRRVMKKDAVAAIMFADWAGHPDFKDRDAVYGTDPEPFCGWTCMNRLTVIGMLPSLGLSYLHDLMPFCRDHLAAICKTSGVKK